MKHTDEDIKEMFYKMKNRHDLAELLEIKENSLNYFLYYVRPENMYVEFKVPKRNGGTREISAPNKKLRNIQRKLAYILSLIYKSKKCSYGFEKGKNFVDNANEHIKKSIILNIDLKDFFNQIHFGRIRGLFLAKPFLFSSEVATTIAQLTNYKGKLPQGAPTSPILTNFICRSLDSSLMEFAKINKCKYTRYADDITFSTYSSKFSTEIAYFSNGVMNLSPNLEFIFEKNGFVVNFEKVKLRFKNEHQEVTGLTVNIFANVNRYYTKNLRSIIQDCKKRGIYLAAQRYISKGFCRNKRIIEIMDNIDKKDEIEFWFAKVLFGKIVFLRQVKGLYNSYYLSFASAYNALCNYKVFDLTLQSKLLTCVEENIFIIKSIDDSDPRQGSGFYIKNYGLFTAMHLTEDGGIYNILKVSGERIGCISNLFNLKHRNEYYDCALYEFKCEKITGLNLSNLRTSNIGDEVKVIGYPNYTVGNSPYIANSKITSFKKYLGKDLCTISGRIVHGMSGGPVLNKNDEVIGLIYAGIIKYEDDFIEENQGFIKIFDFFDEVNKKFSRIQEDDASIENV